MELHGLQYVTAVTGKAQANLKSSALPGQVK
jgi:hypothetical protein